MFVIFIPRIKTRNTRAQNHRINATFRAKAFRQEVKFYLIVSDSEKSCHCMLITVLPTLAALVRDIINPSGSLFPLPSLSSSAQLGLFPFSLSTSSYSVACAQRRVVRCQSEIAIGICQINFISPQTKKC